MTNIYTSTYNYKGDDRLDITVKTGNKAYSPTWEMVWGIKNGSLSETEYRKMYNEILLTSMIVKEDEWNELLKKERVTLVCFCGADGFCHRKLLAEFLVNHFECEYKGEI